MVENKQTKLKTFSLISLPTLKTYAQKYVPFWLRSQSMFMWYNISNRLLCIPKSYIEVGVVI